MPLEAPPGALSHFLLAGCLWFSSSSLLLWLWLLLAFARPLLPLLPLISYTTCPLPLCVVIAPFFLACISFTGLLRSLGSVGADSSLKTEDFSRRSSRGFGRVGVLESGFLQEGKARDLAPSTALHEGESTCSVGGANRRQEPHTISTAKWLEPNEGCLARVGRHALGIDSLCANLIDS